MRGHKRNCRCCRSAACSLLLLLLLSCWLPAATPASPPSLFFCCCCPSSCFCPFSLPLSLLFPLACLLAPPCPCPLRLPLLLLLLGLLVAGVIACCSCFSQGPSSSSVLLLLLLLLLFLLLLLLCRGCSAGAGKGDQRHLDTTKEQTGTWLSARKPEIRLMLVILSSLFARALGRSSRDPITTWLAAGAALRGLVREVVVFHEENELQDAALSAGSHLVLLNAVSAFWISKKAIPSARWAGLPGWPSRPREQLWHHPGAPCSRHEGG